MLLYQQQQPQQVQLSEFDLLSGTEFLLFDQFTTSSMYMSFKLGAGSTIVISQSAVTGILVSGVKGNQGKRETSNPAFLHFPQIVVLEHFSF